MVAPEVPKLELPEAPSERYSKDVLQHVRRGESLYRKGEFGAALAEANRALEALPGDENIRLLRGLVLITLGRHEEALADFDLVLRQVLDEATRSTAVLGKVVALIGLGKLEDAFDLLQASHKSEANRTEFLWLEGAINATLGRYREAIDAYDQALAIERAEEILRAREDVLDAGLKRLVESGFAVWSGGKPRGSKRPVKIATGQPVSDSIVEERDSRRF